MLFLHLVPFHPFWPSWVYFHTRVSIITGICDSRTANSGLASQLGKPSGETNIGVLGASFQGNRDGEGGDILERGKDLKFIYMYIIREIKHFVT